MVREGRCGHRKQNEEQGTRDQVPNAKDHEDQVKHWDMEQVHAIRVQGDPLSDNVERHIRGVVEGVDAESEKQAKDPTDPVLIHPHAGLSETVAREEQEDERRPERGRQKRTDAITERIAEDPAEKARDIGNEVEVSARHLG